MKPDWNDAPEWARFLGMDGDGYWCWFEVQPYYDDELEQWVYSREACDHADGLPSAQYADGGPDCSGIDWGFAYSTLEGRP